MCYTISYCNILYYAILWFNILYYDILWYNILYYIILEGGGQFSHFYICLFAPKSLFLPFSTLVIEWWKSIFFEVLHFTKILKLDLHRLLQLLDQLGFFEISRSGLFVSDSDSAHELMLSPLIDHWTLECHDRCLSLAQGWVARQTTNICFICRIQYNAGNRIPFKIVGPHWACPVQWQRCRQRRPLTGRCWA